MEQIYILSYDIINIANYCNNWSAINITRMEKRRENYCIWYSGVLLGVLEIWLLKEKISLHIASFLLVTMYKYT